MKRDLLREFIEEALTEVAANPVESVKQGLGLMSFDAGSKKALVLFKIKSAAEAALTVRNSEKATPDDYMHALEKHIVGFVVGKTPNEPSYGAVMINSSAALKGFGPMMYDIAMTKWGKIMPDRKHVSPSAESVWTYYANSRSDINRLQLDDIDDPQTPDPQDDAIIHQDEPLESPLNGAYEGANVDTGALEAAGQKFFLWAHHAKIDVNMLKTALRHAGSGFFRMQYLHN